MFNIVVVVALIICCGMPTIQQTLSRLSEAWGALFNYSPPPIPSTDCRGCGARRSAADDTLGAAQVKALRIEFIKQQILEKLLLTAPPKISKSVQGLPVPLARESISKAATDLQSNIFDDFYGKTDQVILFPLEDYTVCNSVLWKSSVCFPFKFSADLDSENIAKVEFWMYRNKPLIDNSVQKYIFYDTLTSNQHNSVQKIKLTEVLEGNSTGGWIKIDLTDATRKIIRYKNILHAIDIECEHCMVENSISSISMKPEHAPFFVIQTKSVNKKRRVKRSVNCAPGVTECCRENLYVSFADIGWSDWIIEPAGYNAYYCRGSCSNVASLTVSGSPHNAIMSKLISKKRLNNRKIELVPCCAATHLSSIQILYMDNNQTIKQKTLPNMVVDSCGCL